MINGSVFYDIKEIVESLGSDICEGIRYFYAFTGCDNVSRFFGKGKLKA